MCNDWLQLKCAFFSSTCLDVMEEYFHSVGFRPHHEDRVGGIVFEGHGCCVEVSYEMETSPSYELTVVIGFGLDVYLTGVPFWFLIPPTNDAANYSLWEFQTETDLRAVLERIKWEIMEPFGRPLWENRMELKRYIDSFRKEYAEFF